MVLRAIVARISPIRACAEACAASALSHSAWAAMPFCRRPVRRSRLTFVSLACASAAASCACSCRVSSWTSRSPARTVLPDSNEIFSTTPGRSALTTTPCTASTDPIADCIAGHSVGFATTVVTASGGILKAACCAMPFLICPYLTIPIVKTKTTIATSTRNIRFFMKTKPPASYPPTGSLRRRPRACRSNP